MTDKELKSYWGLKDSPQTEAALAEARRLKESRRGKRQ